MTTMTSVKAIANTSSLTSILFVAMMGFGLLFTVGHAQSETIHDSAHDVRHATGFPCH